MPWKLGTPLPVLPAGSTVEALPGPAAYKGLKHGDTVPTTAVTLPTDSTGAAESAATTAATTQLAADANGAGYVNLEVIPDYYICGGYNFNFDEGQQADALARSYSTDSHDNQQFTYNGNSVVHAAGRTLGERRLRQFLS